jgi:hypothetical protein
MSFFTSFCDLPQKEQRNVSSVLLTMLLRGAPEFYLGTTTGVLISFVETIW